MLSGNGSAQSFYIDTVTQSVTSEDTLSVLGSGNSINLMTIGIGKDLTSLPFGGLIDDVRIYNRLLTAQEVRDLYRPGVMIRNAVIKNSRINQ